jgi:hypothetical protein
MWEQGFESCGKRLLGVGLAARTVLNYGGNDQVWHRYGTLTGVSSGQEGSRQASVTLIGTGAGGNGTVHTVRNTYILGTGCRCLH